MLPVLVGGLVAVACLVVALTHLRRKRLIDDLPTSKTQGVFIGFVELKGTAESERPLTSYLAGVPCVQYAWHVDEQWSRTVVETYTDSRGHTQTRTRTESGWTRVASGDNSAPFYLQDDTGVIRVVPDGAHIEGVTTFEETCTPGSALYFAKGPGHEIGNSSHRRRFQESAVRLHASLYVAGQSRERQDAVAAEIARSEHAPMFLISTRTERQISRGYAGWFWLFSVLGLLAVIGGIAMAGVIGGGGPVVRWQPYAIGAAGFLFALGVGWVWTVYNSLVNLSQRVKQAWSEVDVQLKRRNDLIPNLVQVVQGYRAHEADVQELVAALRAQLIATPPGVAGPDFKGLTAVLRLVSERYPELKASESFLRLQQAMADMEQRIALARDYYNQIATFYNIRLDIIPDRFVASLGGLRPRTLMGASEFERAPVQVQLATA